MTGKQINVQDQALMMHATPEKIIEMFDHVRSQYHRLILIVAPSGSGKTQLLHEIHERTGAPLMNLNLDLSQMMLELTERRRALQIARLLNDGVSKTGKDSVIIDNIEILFDSKLQQDPLKLLQGVSRNRIVVAAWNGVVENGYLTYAVPGHPEYRRYPSQDLQLVVLSTTAA